MSATALATLEDVLAQLRIRHFSNNDLKLAPVCTRVMLRTGVNLRAPRPDQMGDSSLIARVCACLAEMGYPL